MNTSIDFSKLTKLQKYQVFLRRKYQQMENAYYPLVDELEQKLHDLGTVDKRAIPDFTIHHFSFLKEWQNGECDSKFVHEILSKMNFDDIAEKTITRRLTNFLFNRPETAEADYVKAVRERLMKDAVPLYRSYLGLLHKYFEKLVEAEEKQCKLTWIEQVFHANGEVTYNIADWPINQIMRHLDHHVIPYSSQKYLAGENILVMDEDLGNDDLSCHWIFGPKNYIDVFRATYNVSEKIDLAEEREYIRKVIGVYINEKA